MTENQLSQLLDISGDYVFLRCVYNYESPESTSVLYHADECDTDFIITILDKCDKALVYFYESEQKKNFDIRNKDGHVDYCHSFFHLRKDARATLEFPIRLLYLGIKRILGVFEDDIPF